ncbi:MAG: DUF4870 domain-containing protein [Roseiflexus sp.]|nr:DUF4870 domain-containing protein [Roseiflexus sp.]
MALPDEDERLTAAMAHASIVANVAGLTGLILAVLLWATQRRRSRFVRAHIVQALVYQIGTLLGVIALMLLWSGCLLLSLLPAALRPDLYRDGTLPDTFWIALFGLILPIGYGFAATLYAIYGAYQVYRGNRFAYPLAGRLVQRDLQEPQSPTPASASSVATPGQSLPLSERPIPANAQLPIQAERAKPAPADMPASVDQHPATAEPLLRTERERAAVPSSEPAASVSGTASPPSVPSPSDQSPMLAVPGGASQESSATTLSSTDDTTVMPLQDALDQGARPVVSPQPNEITAERRSDHPPNER